MGAKKLNVDDGTRQIMSALLRMPPKPHEDMKLGKVKGKPGKSPAKRKSVKKSG
jgi:hypothetical protein